MTFLNGRKDPKALMPIGMMFLAIAIGLPRFVHPTAHFGPASIDGVRGMLFGIAIGMNLAAGLAARQGRCGRT